MNTLHHIKDSKALAFLGSTRRLDETTQINYLKAVRSTVRQNAAEGGITMTALTSFRWLIEELRSTVDGLFRKIPIASLGPEGFSSLAIRAGFSIWLALIPLTSTGWSKCRDDLYVIQGTVKGYRGRQPIESVRVFSFLDHAKRGEMVSARPREYPDWVLTGRDGRFEARRRFDSNKLSFFRLHDCTARPKRVVLFVIGEGYLSKRAIFNWKGLRVRQRPEEAAFGLMETVVELPDITLVDPGRAGEPHPPCPGEAAAEEPKKRTDSRSCD